MKKMKRELFCRILIFLVLLCVCTGQALGETVYYVNPNGGRYYHLDPNCPSVNPRYLPLPASMTEEELKQNNQYLPCSNCVGEEHSSVPEEIQETGLPTEEPAWKMIIDPKYSDFALTDHYIDEAPVLIGEHDLLAKAKNSPEGHSRETRYLIWYRDGKLYREIECRYGTSAYWLREGVFLKLRDGSIGMAAVAAEGLTFYRWEESGMVAQITIPGNWQNLYGIPEGFCAIRKDDPSTSAHLFSPEGKELWSFDFGNADYNCYARLAATDGNGTYLVYLRDGRELYTFLCIRDGQVVWQQNLPYTGGALYAGDQTFFLTETTSDDNQYADIILDHRDLNGKSLGTKRLSGDRVVKSVHSIQYNPDTGGYTVYGRAVANSRNVYTVFRMELDSRMNQQSNSVRSFNFHRDYNFSVLAAGNQEAYVFCRTYDESYVQPVLVPFSVLDETETYGLKLH